jgi:hypothetical protein
MRFSFICFLLLLANNLIAQDYVTPLREKLICKPILDYIMKSGYQDQYPGSYEIFYMPKGPYDKSEAFQVMRQPQDEFVYQTVKFIEGYTFYGIKILIHEIPHEGKNYYLAIIDITEGTGQGFDFLLFDAKYTFLDKIFFGSRYDKLLYEYTNIDQDHYGILIDVNSGGSGYYIERTIFLTINKNKFEETLVSTRDKWNF